MNELKRKCNKLQQIAPKAADFNNMEQHTHYGVDMRLGNDVLVEVVGRHLRYHPVVKPCKDAIN
jgi:hypothetical protein